MFVCSLFVDFGIGFTSLTLFSDLLAWPRRTSCKACRRASVRHLGLDVLTNFGPHWVLLVFFYKVWFKDEPFGLQDDIFHPWF